MGISLQTGLLPSTTTPTEVVGPVLCDILEAKRRTAALIEPHSLAMTIPRMLHAISSVTDHSVYGASEAGHFLAGALAHSSGTLPMWRPGRPARVLLTDGVVAGLAGLELAAERARALGAISVEAVILGVTAGVALEEQMRLVDSIVVVDGYSVLATA